MRRITKTNHTFIINPWKKRFIHLASTLIFCTSLFLSGTGNLTYAQPRQSMYDELSVELTILYDTNLKTMKILKQRILNFPPPKNRSKKLEGDQFVFQYENGLGAVLGGVPVNDPTHYARNGLMRALTMNRDY